MVVTAVYENEKIVFHNFSILFSVPKKICGNIKDFYTVVFTVYMMVIFTEILIDNFRLS